MRTTLRNARFSRLPKAIGICSDNLPAIASAVNEATQRLLNVGGDAWWGTFARVVFAPSRNNPYITLPRQFARAIHLDVCRKPIPMRGEFFEFLEDGIGLQDGTTVCKDWCGSIAGYERGMVPTMLDLTPTNQKLRLYVTDAADVGKRVLIKGALDQNGLPIYEQDGVIQQDGTYITLASPFADSDMIITGFSGVIKDSTVGDVVLKQVGAATGAEVTLARYAPDETNPSYRRYYIDRLPNSCCDSATETTVQVTALCKYEFIPVVRDTDFLLIGNIPALIEECLAVHYSEMDTPTAAGLEQKHHRRAIKLLQDELRHYTGSANMAVNVAPFGSAKSIPTVY